jgi:GT2 family glycosyltransferase
MSRGRSIPFSGSIIIVNFNSGSALAECLQSIGDHARGAHVLVVDNASSDGSETVAQWPGLPIVLQQNAKNIGFARAVNQALARTTGDFVLLLNPDCRLLDGAVDTLLDDLVAHPECAIAAPLIFETDGSVQGNVRGDPDLLTGLFGRSTMLTRLFPRSRLSRRNVRFESKAGETSGDTDWVSGACMMMRRRAVDDIGGFDERYFLYWEDADVCRRLRARGHTIRYVRAAQVVHRTGQSSRTAPALATRAFHRSAYTYYATHVARTPLMRAVAWVLLELRCRWKLASQVVRSRRCKITRRRSANL